MRWGTCWALPQVVSAMAIRLSKDNKHIITVTMEDKRARTYCSSGASLGSYARGRTEEVEAHKQSEHSNSSSRSSR